jgi:hypothetical protein
MATPHRLFISYSRVDQAFALKLAKDLGARGFRVWIDQQAIPAGANWDVQVEEGIRKSDCVLAILSPASVDSQQVRDEVLLARHAGKKIFPILYQPCEAPMNLLRLQRVDFTASYEQGLARLVNEVSPSKPLPVMPPSSARKGRAASLGVMLAGLVLVAIVYALVYGLPSRNDETGRQAASDPAARHGLVHRRARSGLETGAAASHASAYQSGSQGEPVAARRRLRVVGFPRCGRLPRQVDAWRAASSAPVRHHVADGGAMVTGAGIQVCQP